MFASRSAKFGAVVVWCALVAGATASLSGLGFDNDNWLRADNPRKVELDTFRDDFEPDEALLLVVDLEEDFFHPEQTNKIKLLDETLEALPEVVSVLSPLSATTIIDTGETLEIGSFAEAMEKGFIADAAAYREKFQDSPYSGRLLSDSRRRVLVRVAIERIDSNAREVALTAIADALRAINITARFAGESALKGELNRITREQLPLLLSIAALMLAVFLRIACGNWARASVIFAAAVAAVSSCLGLVAAFGWPMSAILLALPVMVSVIAVADGLHILATWDALAKLPPRDRISGTVAQTWLPCLGATATSAAGFGAFAISELLPLRHFGFASALTILYAYPLITGAMWSALWIWPAMKVPPPPRLPWTRVLEWLNHVASAKAFRVCIGGLAITALLGGGLAMVRTETNFIAVFFHKNSEIRAAFDVVDDDLGGSGRVEIVRRGAEESFAEHTAMLNVAELAASFAKLDTANHVDSYLLPIGMADRAFGGGGLPQNDAALSQELLFLSLSHSESERGVLAPYLDFNHGGARISLQTPNLYSPELEYTIARAGEITAEIDAATDSTETTVDSTTATDSGVDSTTTATFATTITGFGVFIHSLGEHVLRTQAFSILLTLSIIGALLIAQFGMRLGLAGLTANLLPLLCTAGLVAWLQFPYDFAAILIAGVTISLSVDDTIHFLHHYRRAQTPLESRTLAFSRTARPIAITTVLFCCGLGVIAFSELVVLRRFAAFAMFGIGGALLATLFFLPAILAIFPPRETSRNP